jgi:fatty acid-binding protein DegV
MFGFVQKPETNEWITKVNTWIGELAKTNSDLSIDWTGEDEPLVKVKSFQKVEKLSSKHLRKQAGDTIFLWHYFIDLN